jgi:NADH-quinone oxidoreductase subunit N
MNDLALVVPEAALLALACFVLLVDVYRGSRSSAITFWSAIVAGLIVMILIAVNFPEAPEVGFSGTFKADAMGAALKAFIMVLTVLSFFYARDYFERRGRLITEYFILTLFAARSIWVSNCCPFLCLRWSRCNGTQAGLRKRP